MRKKAVILGSGALAVLILANVLFFKSVRSQLGQFSKNTETLNQRMDQLGKDLNARNEQIDQLSKNSLQLKEEGAKISEKVIALENKLPAEIQRLERQTGGLYITTDVLTATSNRLEGDLNKYKNRFVKIYEEAEYLVHLRMSLTSIDGKGRKKWSTGMGAGSIIEEGQNQYVLTVAHNINWLEKYALEKITAHIKFNHQVQEVEILGYDTRTDAALLSFKDKKFRYTGRPVKFGDSSSFKIGEEVVALGSPMGIPYTLSVGVLGNHVNQSSDNRSLLLHWAATNFGHSGGPLLNSKGEMVGMSILVEKYGSDDGPEPTLIPMHYAVSIDSIKKVLPDLVKGVKR